ncbi:UNVERIFIED_ORG: hypothetical protein FHR35_004969 [Microbispora rosea subsp. rosea]
MSLPVKGTGRVSIAGLIATRPGTPQARPRLIYRLRTHRGRKGERRGFSEADYAALFDAAHQQLGGPIVVVWDNLNTHTSAEMRRLIAARPWLTVFYLPAYAPRAQPSRGRMGPPEEEPGQPRHAHRRSAHCPGEEPAQTDAVPPRPRHRLPH